MILERELLLPSSRERTMRIVRWVEKDPRRLNDLIAFVHGGEPGAADRAAWALGHLGERRPELMEPFLPVMLDWLASPRTSQAVRRNCFRLLQFVDIPPQLLAPVVNIAFDHIGAPESPIAVRCFAMTVAANAVERKPQLAGELTALLRQILPECSAGVTARGKAILRRLADL